MNTGLYSSNTDQWATPQALFDRLDRQYGPFDLDVCATPDNTKCEHYFTEDEDGLQQAWTGRCWCNPPYGRSIGKWVHKAHSASLQGSTVVCLLPARTDTRWWQDYCLPYGEITYLRGRVRFGSGSGSAPFPSAVVVFRPQTLYICEQCGISYRPTRADSAYCSSRCRQAAYRRRVTAKA